MRTVSKRISGIFICLFLLLLPSFAFAAENIDLDQQVSLDISFRDKGEPIVGAEFDLYYVAEVSPDADFLLQGDFAGYPVRVNGLDSSGWKDLAFTLASYAQRDGLEPLDSGESDRRGRLSFPEEQDALAPGLYLLIGHRHVQDGRIYTVEPLLVCLPSLDENQEHWLYDVSLAVKHSSKPESDGEEYSDYKVLKVWEDEGYAQLRPQEVVVQLLRDGQLYDSILLNAENNWRYTWEDLPADSSWTVVEEVPAGYTAVISREGRTFVLTNSYQPNPDEPSIPSKEPEDPTPPTVEPEEPTPSVPTLPQTGQLWWPVPLLFMAGLFLLVLGMLRRRSDSHEE